MCIYDGCLMMDVTLIYHDGIETITIFLAYGTTRFLANQRWTDLDDCKCLIPQVISFQLCHYYRC